MGRYDSHKNPFSYRMVEWALRKTINTTEQLAKSVPMHVQQVEKDFVHASFETKNSIFTMPVVKMPQSFSGYGREPTQQKDMGNAVPSGYYMGGVSGFAGGSTPFYPRGNLSTLSFQPSSNMNSSSRDYDQHTETGGPNGWMVKVMDQSGMQEQGQTGLAGGDTGTGGGGTISPAITRNQQRAMMQRNFMIASRYKVKGVMPTNGSSGGSSGSSGGSSGGQGGQSGQQQDPTQYSYDKNGKCVVQSKDKDHMIVLDQQNKHGHFSVASNGKLYHGGDGQTGKYDYVQTKSGASINVLARIG